MSKYLILLLPLLGAAFAVAREHPANWIEVRSSRFTIVTNSSEKQGRRIAAQFERMRAIFQQAEERMPLWLNEGLAEFYETSEIYDQDVLLGEPNHQRLMLLRQETLLPFTTLFSVDEKSPYYTEEKKGPIFYAECWALTHYLTLRDYAEKTSKVQQYKRQVNDGVDPITAATRVFGDLQKLQRSLESYIDQHTFNHFETRLSNKVDESLFDVKSISPAQVQAMEADFLAASGRVEEARPLFPSVEPNDISPLENTDLVQPAQRKQADKRFPNEIQSDVPCPLPEI